MIREVVQELITGVQLLYLILIWNKVSESSLIFVFCNLITKAVMHLGERGIFDSLVFRTEGLLFNLVELLIDIAPQKISSIALGLTHESLYTIL